MKKLLSILIVIMFVAGCSAKTETNSSAGKSENNQVGPVELTQGSWFPPTDPVVDNVTGRWEKLVKEETKGELIVKTIHGSQLGPSQTLYQDVAGGVYDIGWASPILFNDTELFPYTIANLPFAITDPKSGANIMKKFLNKYKKPKEIEYLGITVSDPYVLWSKKPIKKVEDVKGMKIRAASKAQIQVVKNWGATPVDIPLTDMYEALQKGTLDAVVFAVSGGLAYKIIEVAPYATNIPISSIALLPIMNKGDFNKLSNDTKKLFDEGLGQKMGDFYTENNVKTLEKALQNDIQERKGTLINLSGDEKKKFQVGIKEIWDGWVKEANAKGYPGDEMMKDFKTFIQEEGLTLPF